ncbi:hypothetical protein AcV7_006457 [Taiwanofungus camphoratus]|nr:hypothetical protein AcV7_006457 [Antrodia cinnamomea]
MRLQSFVPPLNESVVGALASCGIKTDADLLFTDSVAIFRKLPPGIVSLREFCTLVKQVEEQAAAPAFRGDQFLKLQTKTCEDSFCGEILCGVSQLDELLGGFSPPRVIEISGDKGSGKTCLALQVILHHLSTVRDSGALWIDSTGEFSADRIPILLESCNGEAVSTVLDRLQVAIAFDIEAAHEVLEALRLSLSSNTQSPPFVRCIVIDSITPLLSPLLSALSSQGHAIMTTFMRQLRALAEAFSLTILVINTSTACSPRNLDSAFLSTVRKPALGPSFTYLTDTTLWLSKCMLDVDEADAPDVYIAEIFRSRTTRSKTWCSFKIRQGVLVGD